MLFGNLGISILPNDINYITKAIETLIISKEKRSHIGLKLREEAEKKYAWKKVWTQYDELLNVIYHKTWF